MNNLLNYLWEGSVCLLLLYAFYRILLAKLTFFSWNRAYLMISLVMVLTVPHLSIQIGPNPATAPAAGGMLYFFPEFEIHSGSGSPSTTMPLLLQATFLIYIVGLIVSLLRLFSGLYHIFDRIRSSERYRDGGMTLFINPDFPPSS